MRGTGEQIESQWYKENTVLYFTSFIIFIYLIHISEEALQIAVKRRDVKSKVEKERYSHLNAEFRRIARRDKKAFLSNQCKEIEGSN